MSVVIRMQRAGGRNWPFFRVVVADSRRARDGRFLEKVGFYNPVTRPAQVQLDSERIRYWVERGAKTSESVGVLLKKYVAAHPASAAPAPAAAPVESPAPVMVEPSEPSEA
jgi:small subunit ribosomal protein S16